MADGRRLTAGSAGFRPVDLRFPRAPRACEGVRFAREVLALVAIRTDGVGRDHVLPFPAAEGRAEHTSSHDDTPAIGGGIAHGDIDAAEPDRLLPHFNDALAGGCFDDGIPGASTEHVGDIIQTSRPPDGTAHAAAQCSTSRYIALCARSARLSDCKSSAAHSRAATNPLAGTIPHLCSRSRNST